MTNLSSEYWITHLQLSPHPEGGYFSEVYRAPFILSRAQLAGTYTGPRNASTHIYFLLQQGQYSTFHRIRSDELWHFYAGSPLCIYEIGENGILREHLLGNDPRAGQSLFTAINAGNWFAAEPLAQSEYSLVGCTVAPGFDFADFQMAEKEELLRIYPQHAGVIRRYCR